MYREPSYLPILVAQPKKEEKPPFRARIKCMLDFHTWTVEPFKVITRLDGLTLRVFRVTDVKCKFCKTKTSKWRPETLERYKALRAYDAVANGKELNIVSEGFGIRGDCGVVGCKTCEDLAYGVWWTNGSDRPWKTEAILSRFIGPGSGYATLRDEIRANLQYYRENAFLGEEKEICFTFLED